MKDSVLNRFIGVFDERDEYQKQEIYKELAFSGIIFYYMTMLLMVASFITDMIKNETSIITIALMVLNIAYSAYIVFRLNRRELDESDCATPEEYNFKKAKIKHSSIFAGVLFGFIMFTFYQYIFPFIIGEELSLWWVNIIIWTFCSIASSALLYYMSKSKLKKQYMEE